MKRSSEFDLLLYFFSRFLGLRLSCLGLLGLLLLSIEVDNLIFLLLSLLLFLFLSFLFSLVFFSPFLIFGCLDLLLLLVNDLQFSFRLKRDGLG